MSAADVGGIRVTAGGIRSASFPWSVITPEGTMASGQCVFLVVPTAGGELGVLADHAALVSRVVPGTLRISAAAESAGTPGDVVTAVTIGEGVVDVRDNTVRLLVTRANVERP